MRVAFLEPLGISNEELSAIVEEKLGDRVEAVYYGERTEDPEILYERSKGFDCLVFSNIRFGSDILSRLPDVKYICVAFTGMELLDTAYCAGHGIKVKNCAGYSTAAVADLVFGFLLSMERNLFACDEAAKEGRTKAGLIGSELEGKKFGVLGAGAIGTRVLKIAQAFGCETYAASRTVKEIEGVQFVSKEELFRICDIVSVHVPQTKETIGLVGKEEIALMKPTAYLINTARGPIVDSEALREALDEGKIAGAAVDVFEKEPPLSPSLPLLSAKNLLTAPHVGFATKEAFVKRAKIVCGNIDGWLSEA